MGNNKELQDWYVQHGICKTCGQENAAPNRKYCLGCLAKAAEATEKYIKNMSEEQKKERKEKEKERQRKRYVERKAAGKCTKCGKRPPQTGKTKCTECLLKSRRAAEKCRRKKGVIPRILFLYALLQAVDIITGILWIALTIVIFPFAILSDLLR